jgi:hypothetical protein
MNKNHFNIATLPQIHHSIRIMTPPEPPPYPAQPSYTPNNGYPQPPAKNGLALTSLICGIFGLTGCCCCPMLASSIAAIICGHLGVSRARTLGGLGRGMALAGLIMGYLSFVGFAAFTVVQLSNPEVKKAIEEAQSEFKEAFEKAQQEAKQQQEQGTPPERHPSEEPPNL